uniref:Terpene synthase 1 n=1 Tax=Callicarpa americana TaxID=204211 RepID=A0A7G5M448_CALAM|nr:terpene synthase 1 [Callicarpa americana]
MSFASHTTSLVPSSSPTRGGHVAALHIPATSCLARSTAGVLPPERLQVTSCSSLLQCNAISRARTEENKDVIENCLPAEKWQENIVEDDAEKDGHIVVFVKKQELIQDKKRELVEIIRSMLQNMDDGEISISPYDTAWVALVADIGGSGQPQFPSSLEWISSNQLPDGSWGDRNTFLAHDRIINTLACVIALKTWKMLPDKCDKGISFIRRNIYKLEDENEEHIPIGFEVALPSLIEIAKKTGIDIPNDSPGIQEIYAKRDLKLSRIPRDIMHKLPTTLLHSLEGMIGLEWQKLLKLQSADGSFLFSPSSTAFALQQTKDEKCLKYLLKHVQKFNGGVPNVYPVDLFEHLWAVDRLQRLGISRYFQPEIDECIDYVHRFWTNKGICWARNSEVQDIDDTAMGFRLLRLHGYEVSADVFKQFENGGQFFCFAGQSNQAVTGMYNLYRASQVAFPGENILEDANKFSAKFLQEKRSNNRLIDKWIIAKDLPGEVGYAVDVPWYASLPRVEARFFLEQYGGDDDVWIGKTLYRMPYVNNNTYLELAVLDYNNCQALHQDELKSIQKWYRNCSLGGFGLSERSAILAYYIAASSVFEPEKSLERLAWAKTAILVETILSQQLSREQKREFVNEFEHGSILKYTNGGRYKTRNSLIGSLIRTVSQLSLDTLILAHGRDSHQQLYHGWQKWLRIWEEGDDMGDGNAELFIRTLNLSSRSLDESLFSHPKYKQLLEITSRVCGQLRLFQNRKVHSTKGCMTDLGGITTVQIESDMQELVKLVLTKSLGDLDSRTKQTFLVIARSFYYTAFFNPGTINFHMAKVLFERV